MKKSVIWTLIVFLIILIPLGSFRIVRCAKGDNKGQDRAKIFTVKVTQVIKGIVEDEVSCVGNIAGQKMVTLVSKVPGRIDEFLVKEGDKVKKDNVLVLITDFHGNKSPLNF
jgi:multidrug efflux pump subunit AcrA (membrane-fusion protein)